MVEAEGGSLSRPLWGDTAASTLGTCCYLLREGFVQLPLGNRLKAGGCHQEGDFLLELFKLGRTKRKGREITRVEARGGSVGEGRSQSRFQK